jgi:hypothetical protein
LQRSQTIRLSASIDRSIEHLPPQKEDPANLEEEEEEEEEVFMTNVKLFSFTLKDVFLQREDRYKFLDMALLSSPSLAFGTSPTLLPLVSEPRSLHDHDHLLLPLIRFMFFLMMMAVIPTRKARTNSESGKWAICTDRKPGADDPALRSP